MTVEPTDRLRLRRLLREAAEAAAASDGPAQAGPGADPPLDKAERERVIELGVTGLIVRFPDNAPVLLEAISRLPGWRPNPSGSHHLPCTLPTITSLLAFAEMYDFELTDGADAMVRQVIRGSYRARATDAPTPAARPDDGPDASHVRRVGARRRHLRRWLGANARRVAVVALVLYLTGPRVDVFREASRAYLEPSPLGADVSLADVLGALSRCATARPEPGATLPPGCDATVSTRPEVIRVALGLQNPRVRLFSWSSADGARGFAACDPEARLESCWDR